MEKKMAKNIIKDQSGAIMITFAVMVNVLILAIALSMDLGRAYMASSAIAGAADAAAVASSVNGGDAQKAKDYFLANLPVGTLGISYNYDTDVIHTVDDTKKTVSVDTRDFEVPAFLSAGTNANSAVSLGGGVVVGMSDEAFLPADYFFIIDSSGSMNGSSGSGNKKREAVEVAINNFLDIVFVNQGVDANGISNYRVSLTNYGSSYKDSHPLEDDKTTILAQLAPMVAYHPEATCGGCGLRDSKERLIEVANDINNNTSNRQRIIIFMTDGALNQSNTYMPPHPLPPAFDGGSFGSGSYGMAAKECYSMENLDIADPSNNNDPYLHLLRNGSQVAVPDQQNVSIWTIRFGSGANNGNNLAIMNYCASDPAQSVYAQTGNDLDQIFSQIGMATSRIRILQ